MVKDKTIGVRGRIKLQLHVAKTGELKQETAWIDNVIVNVGLNSIANRLSGVNSKANAGQVTYCALGTGSTTPVISGTTLDTEIDRVAISTSSGNVDNLAEMRAFFNTSQANGTLTEMGLFGEDASATTDSGTMIQWIAFSLTKTSAETLTVISQITVSY